MIADQVERQLARLEGGDPATLRHLAEGLLHVLGALLAFHGRDILHRLTRADVRTVGPRISGEDRAVALALVDEPPDAEVTVAADPAESVTVTIAGEDLGTPRLTQCGVCGRPTPRAGICTACANRPPVEPDCFPIFAGVEDHVVLHARNPHDLAIARNVLEVWRVASAKLGEVKEGAES